MDPNSCINCGEAFKPYNKPKNKNCVSYFESLLEDWGSIGSIWCLCDSCYNSDHRDETVAHLINDEYYG